MAGRRAGALYTRGPASPVAARAAGAEVLHAPAEHPEYHPGYYAVFLRDPDGHNAEAVHHGFPAPGQSSSSSTVSGSTPR